MHGNETPCPTWIEFCRVISIPDVITYANFGDDRLRGLGMVGVKFCLSPRPHRLSLSISCTMVQVWFQQTQRFVQSLCNGWASCLTGWHPNNTIKSLLSTNAFQLTRLTAANETVTRWLYCVECPQYSTRLEVLGFLCHCPSGRVQR